jgi:hypothetical protein
VEDQERVKPEGEEEVEAHAVRPDATEDKVAATEEPPDVEAHAVRPDAAEDKVAATEEPPDVEAHRLPPKHKP